MAQENVISDEDAGALLDLVETGGLSPSEKREALGMIEEWEVANTAPREDLDAVAISALGGDPEAAQRLADATLEGTVFGAGSFSSGVRNIGVGAVKLPLMLTEAMASDPGTLATVKGAQQSVDNWYATKKQEEIEWFQSNFETPDAGAVYYLAGNAAPTMFFSPGGPLFAAPSTFTRASLAAGVEGMLTAGAMSAAEVKEADQVIGDMTIGALGGLGIGMAFNAVPGVKAYVGRKMAREFDTELGRRTLDLERQVQELTGNPDFAFTIAQVAQENPWLVGLERGVAGRATIAKQNQDVNSLVQFLQSRSNSRSPAELLTEINETVVRVGRQQNSIARQRYGQSIDQLLEGYGEQITMNRPSANQYLSDLDDFIGEMGDPRKANAFDSSALQRHRDFVRQKVNPFHVITRTNAEGKVERVVRDRRGEVADAIFTGRGSNTQAATYSEKVNDALGGLNTEDVVEILKGHNALLSGEASAFDNATTGSSEHVGRRLMASMMTAIDSADSAALREMQNVRNAFQYEMQNVRVLKNSALGQIFGDNFEETAMADPDGTLERMITLGREAQVATREMLEVHAPATLLDLKGAVIRRALQNSRETSTPAALSETSITKLAHEISGRGRDSNVGRLGLGLFTPGEQSELIRVGNAIRVLNATHTRELAKDAAGMASDATINIVSRSPEFMARFVSRTLFRGTNLEQLMIDPSGRAALIRLAEGGVDSPSGRAALTYLALSIGDSEEALQQKNAVPPPAAQRR